MPRNGSGTYTLPASNPVVAGTTIEASWANNTMSDIATELTNSLSRSGAGGMTGPLRLDAGTSGVPGLAWGAETTTGWYRAGTGDIRFAVATVDVLRVQSTGLTLTGALSVSGTTTLTGAATLTANPTLSAGTANGVLYLDGSKVATSGSALTFDGTNLGIGTASPARKLHLDDASTGALFRISSSTNGSARGIEWWNNPTSNIYGSITSDYTSGVWTYDAGQSVYAGQHVFRIGTGGEAMRLNASGNLLIGTTLNPDADRFRVSGNVGILGQQLNTRPGAATNFEFVNRDGAGWRWYVNAAALLAMTLDADRNLLLNTTAAGTSAAGVLALGTGTAPTTGPADTVQLFSVDRSAGNTIPAIRCEGSGVTNAGITNTTVTNKIAVQVNGTIYYLLATTNAT